MWLSGWSPAGVQPDNMGECKDLDKTHTTSLLKQFTNFSASSLVSTGTLERAVAAALNRDAQ